MIAHTAHLLVPQAVAWYGKLPSRGDFVGRGVPRSWSRPWDDWLQRGLALAAQRLGAAALRERLQAMPPWACVFGPVQAGEPVWCGAVVASSDRVGRIFPLLLAEAYDAAALSAAAVPALLDRTRELADWLIEASRERAPLKEFERRTAEVTGLAWDTSGADEADEHGFQRLRDTWPAARSFWWRIDSEVDPPPLAEDWPPRDSLVLDWIGAAGG
ncbi:MAG TPA: type VI secretion system-associated protein TagF [Burkholderiaceae bacterium]